MSGARRYLFVTLSNIGDAIMTTPALEALHAHDPQARIDLLADRRSSSLFDRCPYRGEVFLRDKRAGLAASLRLLRTLRRTRYTALVDLRTHVLGALVRAEHVYSRRGARPAGPHAVEQHFAVVRPLVARDRSRRRAYGWRTGCGRRHARVWVPRPVCGCWRWGRGPTGRVRSGRPRTIGRWWRR